MKKLLLILICFCATHISNSFASKDFLKFGVSYFYPPFVSTDATGHSFGFDIALAETLCTEMHKRCIFTPMPFHHLFPALEQNKVDALIGAISITKERKAMVDFSIPYYTGTMSYVTNKDKNIVISQQGLAGKTICVVRGTLFDEYVKINFPSATIVPLPTLEECIDKLAKQKIDVILFDTLSAKWWVIHSADQFVFVGSPEPVPGGGGYGISVKKGNTLLLNEINEGLNRILHNGKYQQIEKIYLKFDGY